ncbi:hypothetical protein [Methanolacinia paynteri]|uniref:hypothetical protein n=1 Tax=Methanolacinia paynteri TaxID=230356 RepID=UPI00064E926D|nr:hypothetical protein [Methanolacinia paynteri]
MKVNYRRFDDKGQDISEVDHLDIKYSDLIHACITIGEPSYEAARNKFLEIPEFGYHKIFAILTSLDCQNDEIIQNPACNNLEQSEKVVLSFWTGMIFAKIVAERILDVSWPTHVRMMQKECPEDIVFNSSDSNLLPDFIGKDNNTDNWHIIEAKGLRNNPLKEKRKKYKEQTESIATIKGKKPKTRNYCITHLQSAIEIELVDPKKDPEVILKLDFELKNLQNYYYKNIITFLKKNEKNNSSDQKYPFIYKKIPCLCYIKKECFIGIVKGIYEQVLSEKVVKNLQIEDIQILKNELADHFQLNSKEQEKDYEPDISLGSDGIFVVIK